MIDFADSALPWVVDESFKIPNMFGIISFSSNHQGP